MKWLIIIGALAFPFAASAFDQTPRPNSRLSGTIAVTNTFQSIAVAETFRYGCTIQNNGAATMWVFFGPIASATKAGSVVLSASQSVSCNSAGVVLTDQISITGTATQEFYAGVQ